MKPYLPLLFFILLPVFSAAQPDSSNWDRTMDGVNKKSMCLIDTVVTIYDHKLLVIEDSSVWSYDFAEGKRTYLEIKIRTTVCACIDCSYADHILIDITDLPVHEQVELNSGNAVWLIWNSLMIGHSEATFAGKLNYDNPSDFSLEIFKYVPGQSWLTYDGIRVDRQ